MLNFQEKKRQGIVLQGLLPPASYLKFMSSGLKVENKDNS